jgi:hypothetical protein
MDLLHVRIAREGLWPTPTRQDAQNDAGPSQQRRHKKPLNVVAAIHPEGSTSLPLPQAPNGSTGSYDTPTLNPVFVEAMMGFPPNWCRIDDLD